MITGKFKILLNGELVLYTNYDDIPAKFDNVISFLPDFPDGPHTHEEHESMSMYHELLQELLKRESNASGN